MNKTQIRKETSYNKIIEEVKCELSQFGYDDVEVTDILVKYLYGIKESKYKDMLWTCYGEHILENLEKHFRYKTKVIQCVNCGEWIEVDIFDSATCRCKECYDEYRKKYKAQKEKERRNKLRGQTLLLN